MSVRRFRHYLRALSLFLLHRNLIPATPIMPMKSTIADYYRDTGNFPNNS